MSLGLRSKLMLLVGTVVLSSLVAIALYSRVAANRAFLEVSAESEYAGPAIDLDLSDADRALLDPLDRSTWAGGLAALAEPVADSHWLLAFDAGRGLVATSDPGLAGARITLGPDDSLTIVRRVETTDGMAGEERLEVRAPLQPITDEVGAIHGYLVALPRPEVAESSVVERHEVFGSSLGRYLLAGVAVVGVLALLATHFVSARMLRPVEALTRGARQMARGDFGARVEVDRGDELGGLALAFNEMAEGLAQVERWRQHVLDDTAHELRTPLTNLRCRIEAMQDGLVPADSANLQTLADEVLRLARQLDDLRDLSLAEAGRLTVEPRSLALGETVTSVVRALPPGTPAIEVQTTGDDVVVADPARVQQIVRNLLANALVHGAGSEVRVRVEGGDHDVRLHVEDRGPGLDEEDAPRIFERFYRTGDRRGGHAGTGLGLAIVRQLAQAHGGNVEAANRPGGGARFSVRLPRGS